MNTYNMQEKAKCGPRRYQSDLPYPKVCASNNPRAAMLLMESYSGCVSELTATVQYVYASTVMRGHCQDVYEALKYIAIVEMQHLDMLAEAIIALGGDPKYVAFGGRKPEQYWNGKMVSYSRARDKILHESICSEKQAIAQYEKQICAIADASITALLRRIILDEEVHLCILGELLCAGAKSIKS